MTRLQLLEILGNKFPQLEFFVDENKWNRINSRVSHLTFFSYTKDPEDETAIFYLSTYYPNREIMVPNVDTELFFDYISDIILDIFKVECLYNRISSKINKMETIEWMCDWKLGIVLNK